MIPFPVGMVAQELNNASWTLARCDGYEQWPDANVAGQSTGLVSQVMYSDPQGAAQGTGHWMAGFQHWGGGCFIYTSFVVPAGQVYKGRFFFDACSGTNNLPTTVHVMLGTTLPVYASVTDSGPSIKDFDTPNWTWANYSTPVQTLTAGTYYLEFKSLGADFAHPSGHGGLVLANVTCGS